MILHCPHCNVKVARDQKNCVTCKRLMIRRCPACAEDISVLAALCKYCGESVVPAPSSTVAPAFVAPPPPPPAPKPDVEFIEEVRHLAWEDRRAGGSLKRWWTTWSRLMNPAEFWRRAPVEGGQCKPISFAWFLVAQVLTVMMPFLYVGSAFACPGHGSVSVAESSLAFGLLWLAAYPVSYAAVALFVWITAALWHLPLKLLGGKGTFQGTVRTRSYNFGVNVWHLVPGLGSIVAFVLGTFLNYHAFRNVHGLGKFRASLAAAIPWIIAAGGLAAFVACGMQHGCPVRALSC